MLLTCAKTTNGWVLYFEYSKAMVAMIKANVPPSFRSWDPNKKTWTIVSRFYVDAVLQSARGLGYIVEDTTASTPAPRAPSGTWADQLLSGLDADLHKKVVRALARVLHPDMGGNLRLMQELNDADARLRRIA